MPFDGITVSAIAAELQNQITESRIDKIHMPEKDEVILIMRNYKGNHRLMISMNPSYPGIYLTKASKKNPPAPPNFCMFLRKHIGGGIVRDVISYDYERYIGISIESRTELGDMQHKTLMVELTGRNCNLVLLNASGKILDSLKHIDSDMSSVREIMPARNYTFIPPQDKISPADISAEDVFKFAELPIEKAILQAVKGFSPVLCREICHRAGIDQKKQTGHLDAGETAVFSRIFNEMTLSITNSAFEPCVVISEKGLPNDFHCLSLRQYPAIKQFKSLSAAVDFFISNKGETARLSLKKSDLVKSLSRNSARCKKKIALHAATVDGAEAIGELQLMGELITANMHLVKPNMESISLLNYYTGENIDIRLDPNRDAAQNAQKYFKKYKKAKSAVANSKIQMDQARAELEYIESVEHNLASARTPDDVEEIRRELAAQGYIKKKHPVYKKKEPEQKFRPIRYVSSEGYEIFVGRNNLENDYLTFKFANSRDLWLHAKGIPGSHVIIRKKDKHEELFPDKTISEAAVVAAYYSKARSSGQVAVDYSEAKNIKKPNNAQPGMVNYFKYYSAYATADEKIVNELAENAVTTA